MSKSMAEGRSRKKTHKSNDSSDSSSGSDSDYDVHAEISSAMREVEKAMRQVKIATKGSKKTSKDKDRIQQLSQQKAAMSRERAERARQMAASADSGAEKGEFVQPDSTGDIKGNGKKDGNSIINVNKNMYIHIENAQNIQVGSHNTMVVNVNSSGRSQRRSSSQSSENGQEKEQQSKNAKDEPQLTDHAKRVLESVRSPKLADFNIVCGYLGNEWRRFFRYLEFSDDELEQQYISYHQYGIREVIFNSLKLWEEKKGKDAKVCHLAKAFQRLGRLEALLKFEP
ncbi:hypothetical protein CHS0354_040369 [Potamilus streckersoni]|uniref:Death domain-containing protein n=1 Tax=Potamilus streckersoni TaxID=2493646 RepID=A0AAE0S110_9BIVA|nr:hypothetical protein CHS0354_040369 [Potamilus streckersoni]